MQIATYSVKFAIVVSFCKLIWLLQVWAIARDRLWHSVEMLPALSLGHWRLRADDKQ